MLVRRAISTRAVTLALAAAVLASAACEERRPPVKNPTLWPAPAPAPGRVLECRFDPVSRSDEQAVSGFELCFPPSTPSPPDDDAGNAASVTSAPAATASPDAGAAAPPERAAPCPPEMVLVEGLYCPDVRHRCIEYVDEG